MNCELRRNPMAKKEPDVVAHMFAIQVERMLAGDEMSPEFYALFRRIAELTQKAPASTASAWNPGAAAIASGFLFHDGFHTLRAQINAKYVEACHAEGRDPANPGAEAVMGQSSNGEIVVKWRPN
jgi:hypothetical protein